MVEENILSYLGMQYGEIASMSSKFGEYSEFKNKYSELTKKQPTRVECDDFLVGFYKKVLEDAINHFLERINKNKKLSYSVQSERKKLQDIREKILLSQHLSLIELHELRLKTNEALSNIESQGKLIKMTNKEKWIERAIGFVVGIILAFITKLFGLA